jgi:hypothetical protein
MKLLALVLVLALVVCALTLDLRTRKDRVQGLLDALEETESSREEELLPFAREKCHDCRNECAKAPKVLRGACTKVKCALPCFFLQEVPDTQSDTIGENESCSECKERCERLPTKILQKAC